MNPQVWIAEPQRIQQQMGWTWFRFGCRNWTELEIWNRRFTRWLARRRYFRNFLSIWIRSVGSQSLTLSSGKWGQYHLINQNANHTHAFHTLILQGCMRIYHHVQFNLPTHTTNSLFPKLRNGAHRVKHVIVVFVNSATQHQLCVTHFAKGQSSLNNCYKRWMIMSRLY